MKIRLTDYVKEKILSGEIKDVSTLKGFIDYDTMEFSTKHCSTRIEFLLKGSTVGYLITEKDVLTNTTLTIRGVYGRFPITIEEEVEE